MRHERGYVLVSALWLLLLAGVLTALILAQSRERSEAVRDSGDALRLRHALASAIATVNAERLFRGPSSTWWRLPARGDVEIDDIKVTLTLSNDAERIDLNSATREAMVVALQDLMSRRGQTFVAPQRDALILAIEARRASGTPFYSAREALQLVTDKGAASRTDEPESLGGTPLAAEDVGDWFTVASGLATPRSRPAMSAASEPSQGDAIRVTACGRLHQRRACITEIGRFALHPQPGWQRVDGWSASD